MQAIHNLSSYEIPEKFAQMRTKIRFILKHIIVGAENMNEVNYLTIPPPPADEFYYEDDCYAVNDQTEGFQPNAHGSKVKQIKVKTMGITRERVIIFKMETTSAIKLKRG